LSLFTFLRFLKKKEREWKTQFFSLSVSVSLFHRPFSSLFLLSFSSTGRLYSLSEVRNTGGGKEERERGLTNGVVLRVELQGERRLTMRQQRRR
jgi:hypothetical protein